MMHRLHKRHLFHLGVLVGLLALILAGCTSVPQPRPTATPTATQVLSNATPTLPPAFQRLPLPSAAITLPAPNGTLIAALDSQQATATLYDLSGAAHGHIGPETGQQLSLSWLADSSGVAVWTTGSTNSLQILDRDGTIEQIQMQAANPVLSPDSRWLAGTHTGATPQQNTVQIVARHGGPARTLAQTASFLGWLSGQVVYVAGSTVYSVAPTGGAPQKLAPVPSGESLSQVPTYHMTGAAASPDGTVLAVQGNQGAIWLLSGAGLKSSPIHLIDAAPVFWAGQHDALGSSGGSSPILIVIDVLTGAVVHDTGASITGDSPQAFSGEWLLAWTGGQPAQLYAINYATKATLDLGALPSASSISALGPSGRFLLVDSSGATYLVDPTKGGI